MRRISALFVFSLVLGIIILSLGTRVWARVEATTLLISPEGGVRTKDLGALISIPEQDQSDTAKVEFWIDVIDKPFDTTTNRYWKYPVSLDLASGYFHWINANLSNWGMKLVRVNTIHLMQRVTRFDGSVAVNTVTSSNIIGNIPVLLPIPDDLTGVQNLSVVYIDSNGSIARLAVNPVTIDSVHYLEFANNSFSRPNDVTTPYYAIVAPIHAEISPAAVSGAVPTFTPGIRLGETGSRVVWLQKNLNAKGYSLIVDGSFGRKTLAVLRDFQVQNGLAADGVCGPKTADKLISGTTPDPDRPLTLTGPLNKNQYQVVVMPHGTGISWTSARDTAARMYVDHNGQAILGHLVTITSATEEEFIYKTLIPTLAPQTTYWQNFWIGATDEDKEGLWLWLNNEGEFWQGDSGGSAPNGTYSNWYPGRPDNYPYQTVGQDYGELYFARTSVTWDDSNNDDLNSAFIVEYEIS